MLSEMVYDTYILVDPASSVCKLCMAFSRSERIFTSVEGQDRPCKIQPI